MDSTQSASNIPLTQGTRNLIGSALRYLEARGKLFSLESQEALSQIIVAIIFLVIGGIMLLTGWLLLNVGLFFFLTIKTQWSLLQTAFIMAGTQIGIAVVAFFIAVWRIRSHRWFADSINEFRKDRSWLAPHES